MTPKWTRPGRLLVYQRSENPQEAISTIGWFSASILHDLRNRLATICASAELLMDLGQTVRNYGGDMWIEPAAGARFVIRLPLDHTYCVLGRAASSGM
jgi:hypothetical protein